MGKNYEDLKVWQKSINLAADIYKLTENFPPKEIYGLTNQIRRCSVSISSNIAEGCARGTDNEFIRFMNISAGSLAELKTQLIIAVKVGFTDKKEIQEIFDNINEIGRMLSGLKASIKNKQLTLATSN